MNFEEYNQQRLYWLQAHPNGKDGGETNLYRTLTQKHPEHFPSIAASEDPKAQYRCHLAEVFLDFLRLSPVWKPNVLISHGVRNSLKIILQIWKDEGRTAILPGDVYPVYIELAKEVGIPFKTFEQHHFDPDDLSQLRDSKTYGLLLCDPVKPWATGPISPSVVQKILNKHSKNLQLVLDVAYDFKRNASAELLTQIKGQAPLILLSSISKGWLLPFHSGFVVGPTSIMEQWRPSFTKETIDREKIKISYAALTAHSDRYERVQQTVSEIQQHGIEALQKAGIPLTNFHQYFAVTPLDWEKLRDEHGIMGIPSSIFGSKNMSGGTIISLLKIS